jgi:hypothetical protein
MLMGWVVVVVVEGGRENEIEGAAIDSTRYRYRSTCKRFGDDSTFYIHVTQVYRCTVVRR